LIVRGDKSQVTGWGDRVDGIFIPGFHGQYNHLRGFAFFDADEPGWLPWNTTKTGINTDSPVYRATKLEMVRLMRPVVDFLNKLKFEKEGKDDAGEAGPLETMVQESEDLPLFEVKTRKEFTTPRVQRRRRDIETQKIQYTRLREDIEKVKKHANVTSLKKVGEITFDFYLHNEVAD
ncbi:MAG: hypothetical protein NTW07_01240, partial [candidate division Zixibacteria bacterium]|nr:hypothetical protein [candidate division Zixibacteria bacterium]